MKETKMSKAPVYYVLAQARFNPIHAMGKYVADIQDQLRRQGYTFFEQQKTMRLQFSKAEADVSPEPKVEQMDSWIIATGERTAGFILTTSSLTFQTTHYETWERFMSEFLYGLEIINKTVALSYISRLGLRYLNAVLPASNEKASQYFVAGLHGVDFPFEKNYSSYESVLKTECGSSYKGTMVTRVLQINDLLGFPPDIIPYGLLLKASFDIKEPKQHAIIDIDHFLEEQTSLDLKKIKDQLSLLHAAIKEVFWVIVTDYAKKQWS